MDPPPRLACQQCKSRKIKCDKGAPCSACRSVGLSCHTVQRARLPRGKSAKARSHNKTLEARVARIENLLEQEAEIWTNRDPTPRAQTLLPSASNGKDVVGNTINDFVAPDFWSALSEEVYGLREALEHEDSEDEEESREVKSFSERMRETSHTRAILFPESHNGAGHTIPRPSQEVRTTLLDLYRCRVDGVYKIVHWPTVLSTVEANHAHSLQVPPSLSARMLEYAIYFMALCTVTDEEADRMGLGVGQEMLRQYRATVENMLGESNLLRSPDLVTLQAFVIYLVRQGLCQALVFFKHHC
jgi:hypothetical protein